MAPATEADVATLRPRLAGNPVRLAAVSRDTDARIATIDGRLMLRVMMRITA
jgi:hypothetical protein